MAIKAQGMGVVFLGNDPFLQLDPSLDHKVIKRTMDLKKKTSLQFQILYTLNSPVRLFQLPRHLGTSPAKDPS